MLQSQALSILKTGGNVFLSGEPGSGKTYVINEYIAWLEAAGLSVAVTASTGIAATHIGGMTIHSWSGIGIRDSLTARDLDSIATKEKTVKRITKAHVLVIDEISMLDGNILDMVDRVCRTVRKRPESFGGLQVVFVGDFFQLPPIVPRGMEVHYAFESRAWAEARPIACYLTEQYRQEDEMLLGLLQSIRRNDVDESHYTLLSEQTDISYTDIEPTKLYTHNADVDAVNTAQLNALSGRTTSFAMQARGNRQLLTSLVKSCLSPESLQLKEDAMVMCTKNNFEVGYVNGTLGRVVHFDADDGYPVIRTATGREIKIEPTSWSVSEDGKVLAEVTQVPLRLAWAITVHKSQGMSLDAAEIDLAKAFVFGQGYVALSRVRTLQGLKMLGMSPTALRVDPRIVARDEQFRSESEAAERMFSDMEDEELANMHQQFVSAHGGRVPRAEDIGKPTDSATRLKKESTTEATKGLLNEKKTIAEIAKERGMVQSTIWGHIEELIAAREITVGNIDHLLPDEWDTIWPKVQEAIEAVGDEKLKPIFEHLNEEYDYEVIRLGRAYYRLLEREAVRA
ncbi:MAG: helix-turn-helix domain-containing protein [Candidatus Paceibacterota bacterium]